MQASSVAAQMPMIRPHESSPSPAPSTMARAWRPISRNTVFSRTNAIVRQLSRSAIRDCAVCRIGALWPSSSPATTTAITPEACTLLGGDVRRERDHQREAAVDHRVGQVPADLGHDEEEHEADGHAAAGSDAGSPGRPRPVEAAALDDRQRRAQRDQRGGVVEQRLALEDRDDPPGQADPAADRGRGHGVRRCDDGADRERDRPRDPGQQRVRHHADPERRECHEPDREQQDRAPVGPEVDQRGALRGGVQQAAAAARTARPPRRARPPAPSGRTTPTTPTAISRNGAGTSIRSASQVHTSTPTARPQSSRVISTANILPTGSRRT